jgi:hypothetical protein
MIPFLRRHNTVLMLSWLGYHTIMLPISCFHVMITLYNVIMLSRPDIPYAAAPDIRPNYYLEHHSIEGGGGGAHLGKTFGQGNVSGCEVWLVGSPPFTNFIIFDRWHIDDRWHVQNSLLWHAYTEVLDLHAFAMFWFPSFLFQIFSTLLFFF